MDRNTLKEICIGKFILSNRGQTFEQQKIDIFVEGALAAYDLILKQAEEAKRKAKENDKEKTDQ